MTTDHYEVQLDVKRTLVPSMQWLADRLAEILEQQGADEDDFYISVCGPPEMRISVILR